MLSDQMIKLVLAVLSYELKRLMSELIKYQIEFSRRNVITRNKMILYHFLFLTHTRSG